MLIVSHVSFLLFFYTNLTNFSVQKQGAPIFIKLTKLRQR
jgi:hypothetical protein